MLSGGESIRIDDTELKAVIGGIEIRSPSIVCKNGIFNAAYYIGIVPDTQYMRAVREGEIKHDEFPSPFARLLSNNPTPENQDVPKISG